MPYKLKVKHFLIFNEVCQIFAIDIRPRNILFCTYSNKSQHLPKYWLLKEGSKAKYLEQEYL